MITIVLIACAIIGAGFALDKFERKERKFKWHTCRMP